MVLTIDMHEIDGRAVFNLEQFLANLIVPYLYPANCQVPGILQKLTDIDNEIYFGSSERTSNMDQVDISFSLSRLNSETGNDFLAVECKNWFDEVSFTEIEEILSKSFQHRSCTINFIFCRKMKNSEDPSTKLYYLRKLANFCKNNKSVFYAFQSSGKFSYNIIPLAGTSEIKEAPRRFRSSLN